MELTVKKVGQTDLPEEATDGFKILADGETVMFFHWHSQPVEEEILESDFTPPPRIEGEYKDVSMPEQAIRTRTRTSYSEVLKTLPDRMAAFGWEKETDGILGEIITLFGAGE